MSKSRWFDIILSVLAAAFGVQSERNRRRDFQSHSFWPYIIAGVLFLIVFCALLLSVAIWVIPSE
ncbi:DUF2970 domain-containing protein [Balneatrix alpica]|uniref:DUF2970 domain-containing protein n=1 Tax=Balneatrix alpica TaxID=75684 RepID=A0ABV5Z6G0_9GAMM|nr:DUF2970 domain-containing protein [Balneatrix alpica]